MLTPVKTSNRSLDPSSRPAPGEPAVDPDDVDMVIGQMEVGAIYIFADMYAEYVSNVEAEGRHPAHPIAFSRALAVRENMRKARATVRNGDKGKQVRVYTRRP